MQVIAFLKLLHLLTLFIWIGSLLTLSRFLAYLPKEEEVVQKKILSMLKRIYIRVSFPSMCVALGLGMSLFILKKMNFSGGWLHMKLTFAVLLVIFDIMTAQTILKGKILVKRRKYRVVHSVTALSLIAVLASIYILKARGENKALAQQGPPYVSACVPECVPDLKK